MSVINNEEETTAYDYPTVKLSKHEVLALMERSDPSIFLLNSGREGLEIIGVEAYTDVGNPAPHVTTFLKCQICDEIISSGDDGLKVSGGHIRRHFKTKKHLLARRRKGLENVENNSSIDESKKVKVDQPNKFVIPKLTGAEINEIADTVSRLCLRSGKSFNFMSGNNFYSFIRELLSTRDKRFMNPAVIDQFPSRETVTRHTKKLYDELYLCADGAANMVKLGKDDSKFKDYIRCINHSLNLIFERGLNPYDDCKLTPEERKPIDSGRILLEKCRSLTFTLRKCKQVTSRFTVPNPGVPTRWLSYYSTLCDMVALLAQLDDDILYILPPLVSSEIEEMNKHVKELKTIQFVFRLLPERMKLFQLNEPTIQHCLPTMRKLRDDFHSSATGQQEKELTMDLCEPLLVALSTSAHYATVRHQTQLAPIHYGSVMLNPRSKNMTAYGNAEKQLARLFIEENLSRFVVTSDVECTRKGKVFDEYEDAIDSSTHTNELDRFLSEPNLPNQFLHTYWPSKKNTYPSLYGLARLVFSVLPSEAVCERTFSKSAHIIDKRRASLSMQSIDWIVTGSQLLDAEPSLLL